jgi:hypothetical protein
MTVKSAVREVVAEGTVLAETICTELDSLDFSTASIAELKTKYDTIIRKVFGVGYDQLATNRSLPPVSPTSLYDQTRLALTDIIAVGTIFVPSATTQSNLKDLQEFYISVGEDLSLVTSAIDSHPGGIPEEDTFELAINHFSIKSTSARNPNGTFKSRNELSSELGLDTFEYFVFPDISQLYFVVYPIFIGMNKQLESTSRKINIPKSQLSLRVVWFGTVNPSSANFSKMKTTLGLNNLQIRSASFGDDLARSSSSVFNTLITVMLDRFRFTGSSLPSSSSLLKILDAVQKDAYEFLSQVTFGTTVLSDRDVVSDSRESGISDSDLEYSLVRRVDQNFKGADLSANNLRTIVFPQTSNLNERRTLAFALQQEPDTLRFTNNALNQSPEYRKDLVSASKRLVASIAAHRIIIARESSTQLDIQRALLAILADITSLQQAYQTFLSPPTPGPRIKGDRTIESTNNTLTRACDLVKSLRIRDQITQFPEDFDGQIDSDLQEVLDGLLSLTFLLDEYLTIYRYGEVRDFLAACVSVGSMTNVLLADGEPSTSNLITELPAGIKELRTQIQNVLLSDPNTEVLYRNVSIQVGAFSSVLRGNSEDSPAERLLSLPVTVLDSLLPSTEFPESYSIPLENGQEEALRQIRDSFDVLQRTVVSTIRDLGVYGSNYGCAINDAKFFVSRLSGDSVRKLVTELRQS